MRFWNVLKFNIKQQYSYGFYLLYLFLAAIYSLIIFLTECKEQGVYSV